MEELNNVISETQEENKSVVLNMFEEKWKSPVLDKVHQKFGVFGGISLIFGAFFTLLFYKTGVGLNTLLFTMVMIALLYVILNKLKQDIKKGTQLYYAGAALLGLSATLTSSEILVFLNVIGILLLLDLSLLHQFYDNKHWSFTRHFFGMFGLVFQAIASIGMPFADCVNYMKHTRVFKNDKARNIFLGIVISIPILWIVLALLSNADILFGKLTKDIFNVVFSGDIFGITFMLLFGLLACYCIICGAVAKVGKEEKNVIKKADASIAATVLTILCLVYAVFCIIQVIYLFANGLFILPDGFTFAEYARRGFFELLAVTMLNIVLMLLSKELFGESRLLRFLITFMTLCTYIMIGSATYRMLLYIGVYHLTFLRVFVLLSLLIIALVLAGVIISEYKKDFLLFRYCVIVVSVCYIAFSFSRPDYYIASYLTSHVDVLEVDDIKYLTRDLSLDAASIVIPETGNYYDFTREYKDRIMKAGRHRDFRDFNYSNYMAKEYADKYLYQ